ncbi:hypothetical protein N7G274_009404 [Stereocaulon virgatum]|uniref:Vacuolar ATPase assembly protein VMA22 n=1 Tax=Stereocaulon virgatum TaxID=373712 RepID=A0ABR3ZXL0_9LECA
MAEAHEPTTTLPASTLLESKQALTRSLDNLLQRYLSLLDQHQKLQQDLNNHLSNGYLSLAQANFSNPNRIRYGQDCCDDRMQASTIVSVKDASPSFSVLDSVAEYRTLASETNDLKFGPLPEKHADGHESTFEEKDKASGTPIDPLKWFGILVPPALRASQNNFKSAVIDVVPALASVSNEMKGLEIEVRRTRKRLKKAN